MKPELRGAFFSLAAAACAFQCFGSDAEEYTARVVDRPDLRNRKGESFGWHAGSCMPTFIQGYLAFRDPAWIEGGIKYFDWCVSRMDRDPDNYRGWIGPFFGYDTELWRDVHVSDALLVNPMLELAEIILNDPALAQRYGSKAHEYVSLAAKDIVEKWDRRNSFYENGPYGFYYDPPIFLEPGKYDRWVRRPDIVLSIPWNKQAEIGITLLRLSRLTGDKRYRNKATKLFTLFKSRFRYVAADDRCFLNYWDPMGPFDIDLSQGRTRHWVGVHRERSGYSAIEVKAMVEAYHTGVVFTQTDMKRLVNQNLWMWNKDRDNPSFRSADGRSSAGTVWTSLACFDETIRQLTEKKYRRDASPPIGLAYWEKVVCAQPVSWERKYVKGEVEVPEIPVLNGANIPTAAALPNRMKVTSGEKIILVSKVHATGEFRVDLLRQDRTTLVLNIFRTAIESFDMDGLKSQYVQLFDGKDASGRPLPPGVYTVRWSIGNDRREEEITLE